MADKFLISDKNWNNRTPTPASSFSFLAKLSASDGRNQAEVCISGLNCGGILFVYILYMYLKVFKWLKQLSGSDIREQGSAMSEWRRLAVEGKKVQ